jgi:hypothetical protein
VDRDGIDGDEVIVVIGVIIGLIPEPVASEVISVNITIGMNDQISK